MDPDSLTKSHKKEALRAINPIKGKWSRKLEGRKCAYGQPQRCYIPKEDVSLPKIPLETLCTQLIVDEHKIINVEILLSLGHKSTLTCQNISSS